ncbi:MAG: glycosyltransferase [Candidatus Eisenbacteria bacterium]
MPMRVTLIGHYPPPYGGVATLMTQMERALTASGRDVSVFNLGHGSPAGDNVTSFGGRNRVREVVELWRALARSRSDVHHYVSASYRSFWMGFVCLMLARLTHRTMVVSFVGGAFPDFIAGMGLPGRWLARGALRSARALLPCNDAIRGSLEGLLPGVPIFQVTNSFQLADAVKSELPPDVSSFVDGHSPVIASTGAASVEYGLLEAVEALARVREARPNVGYVLVMTRYGNPEYEAQFRSLLEEKGLLRNALVVRNIPDFGALLGRSDVFLRSTLIDGDSMSVREALAAGIPAVTSDTAFRPDGVMLYKKESTEDMAARLEEAFSTPRRDPDEMRAEARRNLEMLLDVYARVTEGSPRSRKRSS